MFRCFIAALSILLSLTKANEVKLVKKVSLTVVEHNLTHLQISWKTRMKKIEPLYILINESKIISHPIKLKEGEAEVKLNPCFSHRLCLGKPQGCITTTTTYIPAEGKQCQSNQTAKTETVLESQNHNIPAIPIVLAGFGIGLGLVGLISAIIIAFSKQQTRKKKMSLTHENLNPLYGNYYFQDDRCNIEVEVIDRNGLYRFNDSDSTLGWEGATLTDSNNSYGP